MILQLSVGLSFLPLIRIVNVIAVQPDGKLMIGGDFTQFNGVTRNRVARLNSDGSLDTSFDPGLGANSLDSVKVALLSCPRICFYPPPRC